MAETRSIEPTEAEFQRLLHAAQEDANILAFWLAGSRGKGVVTPHSDYDCAMVVKDEAFEQYRERYEDIGNPDIEVTVFTFNRFRRYATWGSPEAWDRYNFAHLKALVDKTGEAQALIEDKATIPATESSTFVGRALDHYINQVYRSLKCVRDGQYIGARFEAAEGINPLLDAVFALNGRTRPYFKYLEWEFRHYPLLKLGIEPEEFVTVLFEILVSGDVTIQQALFGRIEGLFRAEGYGSVFESWCEKLTWIKTFRPEENEG